MYPPGPGVAAIAAGAPAACIPARSVDFIDPCTPLPLPTGRHKTHTANVNHI